MGFEECHWRSHPDFSYILVSDTGLIMSGRMKEDIFTLRKLTRIGNYYTIVIDGKRYMVHRLVAETYLPCENTEGLVVNHKDGNSLNNCAWNLEWCTQKENIQQAYNNGVHPGAHKIRIVETGEEFVSIADCARHIKGHTKYIYRCLNGEKTSYKNLHFENIT